MLELWFHERMLLNGDSYEPMPNDSTYFERSNLAKVEQFQKDAAEVFLPQESNGKYKIPEIACNAFGDLENAVRRNIQAIERFLALPIIPYRFSDHHDWSAWKKSMRVKYGEALANEQLKRFEENKLRTNSLSGLAMAGDILITDLEHGTEEDIRFAHHIDMEWRLTDVFAAIERYKKISVSEGVQMMLYFDMKALDLLYMIHDEAERRLSNKKKAVEIDEREIAAK